MVVCLVGWKGCVNGREMLEEVVLEAHILCDTETYYSALHIAG